jgi:twinkle protein
MQLKQFAQINLEDHLDQFDAYADRFQRLPLYYLTFHGSNQVRFY